MSNRRQLCSWIFGISPRAIAIPPALIVLLALTSAITPVAHAQTFKVIHTFDETDGAFPSAGLTIDHAGNLYGTTSYGGQVTSNCNIGCGTVFKLVNKGQWLFTPLYNFQGGNDGADPEAPVTIGPDGTLYGTTYEGSAGAGGTVYNLKPKPGVCKSAICPWTETVLSGFHCCDAYLLAAPVVFDQAGNLYGTAVLGGGPNGRGAVYQLARSGGGWTKTVIHGFGNPPDGAFPYGSLIFDQAGNLYGTTSQGGQYDDSTVFELTPSQGAWTETILYSFNESDGNVVDAGLIFDDAGNLYGASSIGGALGLGTVFELTPSSGTWSITRLYQFLSGQANQPIDTLVRDAAGNLYGTGMSGGANGYGAVFRLTPSNGSWTYTSLHDFAANGADGRNPNCSLVVDANGNLYGTSRTGGNSSCAALGCGTVWMITP